MQNKTIHITPSLHKYLIIIIGIIVYYNSFEVGWQFDGKIIEKLFRDLGGTASLKNFFTMEGASYIGYAGWVSFYLNQFISVNGLWEYHLINLIIHIGNGLLIYQFILLTFATPYFLKSPDTDAEYHRYYALFAAMLFVVHPISTQ